MTEAPNSSPAPRPLSGGLSDVLADVLRRVHLSAALFLRGEFSAPWAFASNTPTALKAIFAPESARLVLFHVAVEGSFRIVVASGDSAVANPGDAVVLPYCDAHAMGYPDVAMPAPIESLVPPPPWKETPVIRYGGGGEATRILCGYLHCDDLLFHPLLSALPRLLHVRPTSGQAAQWREATVRYALDEAARSRPGSSDLFARLPELVFMDCLRQYVEALPASETGLLAALRDPIVAQTLVLIHAQPDADWTVPKLARSVAVSRSVLADRFHQSMGISPMRYLARWRIQLASELLRSTDLPISAVAARVGYESEAAFSRAFKRHANVSPAAWRERNKSLPR
jgi:AraC-like DNA-binding protein